MKYSKIHIAKEAIKHRGFLKKIPDIFRMYKKWRKGEYITNSINLILPVIGMIYVISPIDLLPEIALPVVGVMDDLAVLYMVIPKLIKEVDKFLMWELGKTDAQLKTIDAEVVN